MTTSTTAPRPLRDEVRRHPAAFAVATALGAGFSPIAPGTAGSLVGLALFWPLSFLPAIAQAAATVLLFVVGVAAATTVSRAIARKDPGLVVVDEVVGMWTSLLLVPLSPLTVGAAFVLFRVMDVFKPYPARDLERLPEGWGIMSDDLMAGVYANLLLRALLLAFAP